MDGLENKNTKTDKQDWRKKPRKFAPKSRLGCKTCKIRRIKCDLSRPTCLKCHSTGRTCDGYNEMPFASMTKKTEIEPAHYRKEIVDRTDRGDRYHACSTVDAYEFKQWHSTSHGHMMQNLGSLMILPVAGSTEAEAMCFFEDIAIKRLNPYRPCVAWRKTLMFFSQTMPSVRHAAIALASIHRNYLDRHSHNRVYQPAFSKDQLQDPAPLLHYNRAIQLLLNPTSGDSAETTAVTLLVCYLFTCIDHLAGDNVQAVKHLRGGVALSRNIDNATFHNCNTNDTLSSGADAVIRQVTHQIRRLDMQAVMFLVDWTPANMQDAFTSHLALSDRSTFRSLDQAADHLQILVAQVMRLRNTGQQMSPTGTMPPLPPSLKDSVLRQLGTWMRLFERFLLHQGIPRKSDAETTPLVPLLRLQHTIAWILLNGYGPGKEMDYDKYLAKFQDCVALAREVAAADQRDPGAERSTFTPEIGLIPVLYIIGVKCRHPVVRRQVLGILRRQRIREAAWDSIITARVVERVIEIEEGTVGERQMVQCMGQIPMGQ
ncbi:Zn(II)2Cys6 transcription factor, partial [Aspergillus homomorphus CBS 101889]